MSSLWALRPFQRHSLVLVVAGIVYASLGLVYLLVPMNHEREVSLSVALLLTDHSMAPWASLWLVAGFLAILSSRWPPASKTWGYTALSAVAGLWGSFYWLSVAFGHSPASNLSGTAVWYLVGFMWWAIAGLVNPDDVTVIE